MLSDAADTNLPDHRLICRTLASRVPGVESIVLAGSRALSWDRVAHATSDYDIIVVLNSFALPFALRPLKAAERELSVQLGTHVTVNPLLKWRMRRARGNLYLYRLCQQALVLYGKDPRVHINAGALGDIPLGRFFSYYFSTLKKFLEIQPPVLTNSSLTHNDARQTGHLLAKVILQVAELIVMLNERFPANPDELLAHLQDIPEQGAKLGANFQQDVVLALRLRKQETAYDNSLLLWNRTRLYLVAALELLGSWGKPRHPAADQILQNLERYQLNNWISNLQYVLLRFLFESGFCWQVLVSSVPVTDRVWKSAGWLLLAVESDRIRSDLVANAKQALVGCSDSSWQKRPSTSIDWAPCRDIILEQWPFACTVIGV